MAVNFLQALLVVVAVAATVVLIVLLSTGKVGLMPVAAGAAVVVIAWC
jgi:hypothetical protein